MNVNQSVSIRPPADSCPGDALLREFDAGTLSLADVERLSEHVVGCGRCSGLLTDQRQEDTRLMAELLTPGTHLLAERAFQQARRSLLQHPETISFKQLETAESTLGAASRLREKQLPGQVGPYRLRYELGQGAMGLVYRARHVNLKRDAALKILHPRLTQDQEIVQRFYREMEALGQLRDPHIVQAYDAGESGGVHFLAMEFVDGADAARLCAHANRLAVADACEIVCQAALGLETARHHKLIHRDIKPSNLIVARNGQVKILDLGLASMRQEDWELGFDDDDAVGTMDYMAPEQWQGSPQIDIRADIYSLGCTLFKLLAGQPPFYDAPDESLSKMQAHTSQPAPALREIRRDVPRDVDALVARMLSKKPKDRIHTPQEVAEALQPYRKGGDLAALVERCVPAVTGEAAQMAAATALATSTSRTPPRWKVWAIGAALAGVCAVLAMIMIRWMDDGTMVVTVDHAGARVRVGPVSITTEGAGEPVEIKLKNGGQHQVTVTKEGFEPYQKTVDVRRWSETPVDIRLAPQTTLDDGTLVLAGHRGPLESVEISPDGTRILTGAHDRTLRLWDAQSGESLLELTGHEDAVLDVLFTPDGTRAVSASKDRTARLWDLETGQQLQLFSGHRDAVLCAAISEDGNRLLTGSVDAMVRLWDVNTGTLLGTLGAHRSWVRDVTFLPGSQQAVSCSNDSIVILWDLETQRMRKVMQGHSTFVGSVGAAPDGRHVVTGSSDTTVRLWDLRTARQLTAMRLHTSPVQSVKFIPGSQFVVSSSSDRDVRVWNPFSGQCVAELLGYGDTVTDVAVNLSAGLLVSASQDRTARVEKLPPLGKEPTPADLVSVNPEPTGGGSAVAARPVRKWSTGQENLQAIAVAPNGQRIATAGDDGVVRIWQTETGQLWRELHDATDGLLCVLFSSSGEQLAAAGKDSRVYVWDLSRDAPAKILAGHNGWVASLAFSRADGRLVSGGFDATIHLWDVDAEKPMAVLPGQIQWIRGVALAGAQQGPLPLIISAGNAGCVRLWKTRSEPGGRMVLQGLPLEAPWQNGAISSVALTPDGQLVAAAGWNRPLRVWSTANGQLVSQLGEDEPAVFGLQWYGDSQQLLAACADGTLRVWDRQSGRELQRGLGHTGAVRGVSLSEDGRVVASTGDDGLICVWPSMKGQPGAENPPGAENTPGAENQPGAENPPDAENKSETNAPAQTDDRVATRAWPPCQENSAADGESDVQNVLGETASGFRLRNAQTGPVPTPALAA